MTGEVIKSFLVGLGFEVDEASLAKFNKSIAIATARVTALYAAVNAAAGAIVFSIAKISESFEGLGYELHLIAPMINKVILLRQEMFKAYSSLGVNMVQAAQNAVRLNISLAKTKIVLSAIYNSVGSKFFTLLTKQSDIFRQKLYANMPKIQNALERFVKFIFKAFEAVTQLGSRIWSILTRVYDFFVMLDKATDGWSSIIFGVIAAWKLLNLSFLATPFGMILAGLVAILALYDDFKTWQEGGKSLFDWTKFIPVIDAVKNSIGALVRTWRGLVDVVLDLVLAFMRLGNDDLSGFFSNLADSAKAALDVILGLWGTLKGFLGIGAALGGTLKGVFGDNASANLQNNPVGRPLQNPIGVGSNSATNQNVNQQTQINVMGSADANAVGKSVAGEQSKVNFNMVRNMKGATR